MFIVCKKGIAIKKKTPTYDSFAGFYDLEYGHKDDDLDFYLNMADEFGSPVLEIGAGTGRVAIPLADAGHTIWGIDNSVKMLEAAEKNLLRLPAQKRSNIVLSKQNMQSFSLQQEFPLCIIPFRAFLHNLTMDEQVSTLLSIHHHLQPEGILAFDLFVPLYSVISQKEWQDEITEDEFAQPDSGVTIKTKVTHDYARQLLNISNTYLSSEKGALQKTKSEMIYRYVFRYEMEALLRLAGFDVLNVYGGFEGQEYDFSSGLMVFVARKKQLNMNE
ncbi:MAG: class I SAM-dependent methyltransferase [Calditrichaeota bacterium]|nr:class I SAM-dependent methyltransferase [Calditrichota bacterium]